MRRHPAFAACLPAAAATAVTIGVTAAGAGASTLHSSTSHSSSWHSGTLPQHVFAPYFETYDTTGGTPAALSRASGARVLSLAFLQTAQAGSCTASRHG